MPKQARRALACLAGLTLALAAGACGSSDGAVPAKVGDCIDGHGQVVACSSSKAKQKLLSNQDAPNAIACVQIGTAPQHQMKVGNGTFCAEPVGSGTATTGSTGATTAGPARNGAPA